MKKIFYIITSFSVLTAVWQLVVMASGVNRALFPGPVDTLRAFGELFTSGLKGSQSSLNLWQHIGFSMYRFGIGYAIAVVCGVAGGIALGIFSKAFAFINPVIQIIRPIAPVAWLPFIVLVFGIGDIPAIVIIFIAGFFPILLSTVSAVNSIDETYIKVASNFELTKWENVTKVIFPASFPQIMNSLRLALGTSWIFLVSGEMVGSQSGLGFLIMDAKNAIRMDALMAVIITIGVIGFVLDFVIRSIERKISKNYGV